MKRKVSDTILERKLGTVSPENLTLFLSFLPTLHSPSPPVTVENPSLRKLFANIHPDWYMPYLNSLSEKEQSLFLSALGKESSYSLSEPLSLFLLNYLFYQLFQKPPLPPSFLSDDRLFPLALASYKQLKKLFRLLSLFDLLPELKKVLEARLLKKIEEMLTEEECSYLDEIKPERTQVQFGPIDLHNWGGNVEKLEEVLLTRGMNRLAKALSLSSRDLIWYIEHALDPADAKKFNSFLSFDLSPRMAIILTEQVLTTWKKLCTASH